MLRHHMMSSISVQPQKEGKWKYTVYLLWQGKIYKMGLTKMGWPNRIKHLNTFIYQGFIIRMLALGAILPPVSPPNGVPAGWGSLRWGAEGLQGVWAASARTPDQASFSDTSRWDLASQHEITLAPLTIRLSGHNPHLSTPNKLASTSPSRRASSMRPA